MPVGFRWTGLALDRWFAGVEPDGQAEERGDV